MKEILIELNLESNYFGILINGKNADINAIVHKNDKLVILPYLAGGAEIDQMIKEAVPDFLFLKDVGLIKVDINAILAYRECFRCGSVLHFRDFIHTNKRKDMNQLITIWQSQKVEIYCCSCIYEADNDKLIRKALEEVPEKKCSNCGNLIKFSYSFSNNRSHLINYLNKWTNIHRKHYCEECKAEMDKRLKKKRQKQEIERVKLMRERWHASKVTVGEIKKELGFTESCIATLINGVRVSDHMCINPAEDVRFLLFPSKNSVMDDEIGHIDIDRILPGENVW